MEASPRCRGMLCRWRAWRVRCSGAARACGRGGSANSISGNGGISMRGSAQRSVPDSGLCARCRPAPVAPRVARPRAAREARFCCLFCCLFSALCSLAASFAVLRAAFRPALLASVARLCLLSGPTASSCASFVRGVAGPASRVDGAAVLLLPPVPGSFRGARARLGAPLLTALVGRPCTLSFASLSLAASPLPALQGSAAWGFATRRAPMLPSVSARSAPATESAESILVALFAFAPTLVFASAVFEATLASTKTTCFCGCILCFRRFYPTVRATTRRCKGEGGVCYARSDVRGLNCKNVQYADNWLGRNENCACNFFLLWCSVRYEKKKKWYPQIACVWRASGQITTEVAQ